MKSLTAKTALALGWHVVDLALDAGSAPRWSRLLWAGVGMLWASYFFSQLEGSPVRHYPMRWYTVNPKYADTRGDNHG